MFNAAVQGTLTLSTKALTGSCRFYSHVYVAEISLEPFRDGYLWRGEKYLAVIVVLIRNPLKQLHPFYGAEVGRRIGKY